jgi:Methyltransferase small domain
MLKTIQNSNQLTPDLLEKLESTNPTIYIDHAVKLAMDLRQKAIDRKVPDFSPTPAPIISQMLELLQIEDWHRVLDPSAGAGDMAIAVRNLGVKKIDCFEINDDLVQALKLQSLEVLSRNFLTATPRPIYDRILMNPPHSKNAYIEHVRNAYHWLFPGGELVALLPNGYRDSSIGKHREFANWLDALGVDRYEHSANAFTKSDRSCGVSTHLIHIKR